MTDNDEKEEGCHMSLVLLLLLWSPGTHDLSHPDTAQSLMLQNSLKPKSGYNISFGKDRKRALGKEMVSSRCVVRRKQAARLLLAAQPRFAVRVQQLHAALHCA